MLKTLAFGLVALFASSAVFGFFGTLVTPIQLRVRLLENGMPAENRNIAVHSGAPGAEAYWPWPSRGQLVTDAKGETAAVSFSSIKSASVLTRRLPDCRALFAIAGVENEIAFVSADLSLRKDKATRAKVYAANLTEFARFSLVKPASSVPVESLKMTVQSEAVEIDGKPGWAVWVTIRSDGLETGEAPK